MLLNFIFHFFIGFVLSFIGSIPFGMINVTVADMAIKRGLKAGIWLGFGAAVVEFFQAFIAIKFTHLFVENPAIDFYFNVIALLVFFGLAAFYLFFQKPKETIQIKTDERKIKPFWKGMLISSMNVLVFPYWIFYGTYLNGIGWLKLEIAFVLTLCLGIFFGGLFTFSLFAKMGTLIIKRGPALMNSINIFIGLIFLGFGFFQIWKLSGF